MSKQTFSQGVNRNRDVSSSSEDDYSSESGYEERDNKKSFEESDRYSEKEEEGYPEEPVSEEGVERSYVGEYSDEEADPAPIKKPHLNPEYFEEYDNGYWGNLNPNNNAEEFSNRALNKESEEDSYSEKSKNKNNFQGTWLEDMKEAFINKNVSKVAKLITLLNSKAKTINELKNVLEKEFYQQGKQKIKVEDSDSEEHLDYFQRYSQNNQIEHLGGEAGENSDDFQSSEEYSY